jgi:hypothetical protein
MCFVTAHLRWNTATPQQYEQLRSLLHGEQEGPFECLSQRLHRVGEAVLAIVVWESELAADRFRLRLGTACEAAGLAEPGIAVVAVPAMFLAGYRRRQAPDLPRQRSAGPTSSHTPATRAVLP